MPGTHPPLRTHTPNDFDRYVAPNHAPGLVSAERLHTVQVNIGLKCNLTCRHCHVNSSPKRKEAMDWPTMEAVLRLARALHAQTIDITGGAPEMHPDFKRLIAAARAQGHDVIVRTNLTILLEPGYEDCVDFFRAHRVHLIASLPCYLEENVDTQRGQGVYRGSVEAIRRLNAAGYGTQPEYRLDLIYNPVGPSLPPDQQALEDEYRRELDTRFGIRFNRLYTLTNVPIGRFRSDLRRSNQLESYRRRLRDAFNSATVEPLMCRHQISVAWDGTLYDCDFNLALRWPAGHGALPSVQNVDPADLIDRRIVTGEHCFACTAGAGSSCGGALV